ncbi:PPE family protein [Mycobacterium tuberculosis]|nr:PPE family protein [Mycobacterium tuberculosis]
MYSGAGSSPLLAAAAAWDGLAEELGSAAVSFGQVTSGLTAGVWQGAAAAAMAAAAAPYAGWLGSVAAEIQADMGINAPQMSARLYAIGILQISLSKCPRSPRRGETMRCERIVSGRGRGG